MSISTQDLHFVESRQDLTEPKQSAGPMAYLAVLVILAAIMALMAMFCSIGSAKLGTGLIDDVALNNTCA